ncbi:MAG TPA: CbtA family protein [Devosiaceae bacterium]|jgi:hypothetical protein|nr:CbtA family protein [Devosiaceae bacterium]
MARSFLIRGMLCGLAAGILVFLFARFFGEPSVDGAIAVEEGIARAAGEAPEPELVSRAIQASWGLFTGTMLFSIAMGGIFALVFAFAWGRVGRLGPRATAALLAAGAFVTIGLVPFLKYPANPPSVGNAETLGLRTALYFGMIAISVVAAIAALNLARSLWPRLGAWNAVLAGGAAYVALVAVAGLILPPVDEVPGAFPATLLWNFRVAALGIQAVLWGALGLSFGWLTERSVRRLALDAQRPAARGGRLAEH